MPKIPAPQSTPRSARTQVQASPTKSATYNSSRQARNGSRDNADNTSSTAQPISDSNANSEGFVGIIAPPKTKEGEDHWLEVPSTPRTKAIKEHLVKRGDKWLWQKICFWAEIAPKNYRKRPKGDGHRMFKIEEAWDEGFLNAARYPSRPTSDAEVEASSSFRALQRLLARGPTAEQKSQHVGLRAGEEWPALYHREIHDALSKIIAKYGVEGWERARWIVYDKHSDLFLGFQYELDPDYDDPRDAYGEWVDGSHFWLDAKEYKHMSDIDREQFCASLEM